MKTKELFELQSALVTCLTDPAALSEFKSGAAAWKKLSFVDPGLMDFLSSLYVGKRIDKLTRIFPLTLEYLAPEMDELIPEFVKRHPPINADSYTAGCQFYHFLRRRWLTQSPDPPFLPDLAYCELARVGVEKAPQAGGPAVLTDGYPVGAAIAIRRRRGVRLHVCEYNVQPLFAPEGYQGEPIAHEVMCVVLSRPLASYAGKIYFMDQALFGLLRNLNSWTRISLADDTLNNRQTSAMLQRLEALGCLEVQLCESE